MLQPEGDTPRPAALGNPPNTRLTCPDVLFRVVGDGVLVGVGRRRRRCPGPVPAGWAAPAVSGPVPGLVGVGGVRARAGPGRVDGVGGVPRWSGRVGGAGGVSGRVLAVAMVWSCPGPVPVPLVWTASRGAGGSPA
ncbi:hypothetical protein D7193_14045 [Micromonospora costi]|uniref:Uncharacterized protein n=1 Tax=Micromonospora costi TaxID=1530042 RepID=A0A3B0A5Q8_9ACTN|nr:hypothetical protein D7193_14045 [Micromonospora costi]